MRLSMTVEEKGEITWFSSDQMSWALPTLGSDFIV